MPKSIPTLSQQNWGQPLNDHLSQLNDPTTGGINKWTTASRPASLTTNDAGKTGINVGTGEFERWTGSGWENLTLVNSIQLCDIIYADDADVPNFLNTTWPPVASFPQVQRPVYPIPEDTDIIINRKTNKVYNKIAGTWTAFTPEVGYTAVQKFTGSVFRYRQSGANLDWQVTSAHGFVNIRDWGARGDGFGGVNYGTDDTQAIQAAINFASQSANPGVYGIVSGFNSRNSIVYVPFGTYSVTNTINVPGMVTLQGETGISYSGSIIGQQTGGISLFNLTPDTDGVSNGCGFRNLLMRMSPTSAPVGDQNVAAITCTPNISSNSIYIKDCFFQVSPGNCYSIFLERGDDIQISGCTFDVGSFAIKLGSAINAAHNFGDSVTNCTIQNNTLFAISNRAIQLVNVSNINIIGNRLYGTAQAFGIDINSDTVKATNINIVGNTFEQGVNGIWINSNAKKINITSNIFTKCTDAVVRLAGGSIVTNLIIQSNNISGNFLPISGQFNSGGAIDGNGCGMTNSIIKDNIIQGNENGTNSTVAINFPDTRTTGNNIKENIIYGFSGPNVIANPAQNVL
jgi:hypothetical protein